MSLHFTHPVALALLALAPACYAIHAYGMRRRRLALERWECEPAPRRRTWKGVLQSVALACVAIALAGPSISTPTPPSSPQGSADIVFLLDVSRSMLATDIAPNRLAHAKSIVREIAGLDRGNRLALVAFAGGQAVACPLTVDHAFFGDALIDVSPSSVDRGGTRIGDAIRFVMERVFDDVQRSRRTLVILSDGEDHESDPQSAASDAGHAGVHVVSIGIGQEAGAIVPVSVSDASPFLYQGQPVRSRLDPAMLRAIVQDGTYLDDASEPGAIYRQWLAPAGRGTGATQASEAAWAVLLAVALVLLAVEQRRGLAALLIVVLARPASAQTIEEWFNNGLAALEKEDYAEALRYFGDAARWSPEQAEIRFNLAKALYGMKSYEEAALAFEHAAAMSKDAHLKAQARLGQGNSWFRHATEPPMSDIEKAIAGLRTSISAYREALKIEPGLFAADINVKVAERKLKELLSRPRPDRPMRYSDPSMPPMPSPPTATDADADQILKESRKTALPQSTAKGAAVDKDW